MDNTREIMAIEDHIQQIYGVQFHPESLLTEAGHDILQNFLRAAAPTV
jgi:anthranilate/para-aminobenzoate synthase component II